MAFVVFGVATGTLLYGEVVGNGNAVFGNSSGGATSSTAASSASSALGKSGGRDSTRKSDRYQEAFRGVEIRHQKVILPVNCTWRGPAPSADCKLVIVPNVEELSVVHGLP